MHLSSSEEKLSGRKSPRFVGKRERERERVGMRSPLSKESKVDDVSKKKSKGEKKLSLKRTILAVNTVDIVSLPSRSF